MCCLPQALHARQLLRDALPHERDIPATQLAAKTRCCCNAQCRISCLQHIPLLMPPCPAACRLRLASPMAASSTSLVAAKAASSACRVMVAEVAPGAAAPAAVGTCHDPAAAQPPQVAHKLHFGENGNLCALPLLWCSSLVWDSSGNAYYAGVRKAFVARKTVVELDTAVLATACSCPLHSCISCSLPSSPPPFSLRRALSHQAHPRWGPPGLCNQLQWKCAGHSRR